MVIKNDIKDEEMKVIEELRHRFEEGMEQEMHEDIYFFRRFLAARDFNIDKAETMIRKHLEFREKYDVKNLVLNYKKPEVIEKFAPHSRLGYDKEGCAIIFIAPGKIDINGIMSSCKFEDLINLVIYEVQIVAADLKKQSEKFERNIDKVVGVVDLTNLSFSQVSDKRAIHIFLHQMRLSMNNFPETLKAVYVFNVSLYFNFVYSLMKSVLPSAIIEKIHVYSDDSYKKDLLEVIDADVLPAFLGGSKTDPDGNPLCLTFGVKHGADPVPESYYITKTKRSLSKLPGVKKATLTRAEFQEVKLEIKEPGSYLEWEFETKCRDIGFGLFYEELIDGKEKLTELVPLQRIDTEEYPETGTIKCDNLGTYVIVFDNTYSWVRGKEIYYRAKIISPKEHESEMKE